MSNSRNAEAITEVFNRYDPEGTGKIDKETLRSCIFDLNGRKIDDVELNHIFELMDGDKDGMIHINEFVKIIEQFFRYC